MTTEEPGMPPRIRPGWVWAIFIFYVLTSAWGLLAWVLVHLNMHPAPEQQLAMVRSQSIASLLFGFAITLLSLTAATMLWLLRRRAFDLFVAALVVSLGSVVWQLVSGGPVLALMLQDTLMRVITGVSFAIGYGTSLAVCIYAWKLRQRGVLK